MQSNIPASESGTDSLNNSPGKPIISIDVHGSKLKAFIDTGSCVTLIKKKSWEKVTGKERKSRSYRNNVSSVNGKSLDISGMSTLTFTLTTGEVLYHNSLIASNLNFPGDILLGMDFLARFEFVINHFPHQKCTLSLNTAEYGVTFSRHANIQATVLSKTKRVKDLNTSLISPLFEPHNNVEITVSIHSKKKIICLPNSVTFVPVTLSKNVRDGSNVIVHGRMDNIILPHLVTTVANKSFKVPITNVTAKSIKIPRGACLSIAEVIEPEMIFESERKSLEQDNQAEVCAVTASPLPSPPLTTPATPPPAVSRAKLAHLSPLNKKQIKDVLSKFPSVFAEDGEIGLLPEIIHHIPTGDSPPVQTRQWRLPQASKEVIKEECQNVLKQDVIEPSSSPWLSPVVLVRKPDKSYRFCVDYRKVNDLTVGDSYPLPLIQEIMDSFGEAKYFSTLDAKSAYWAVPIAESDRPKTAFSDGTKLFQFKRMPFGLKTAPSTFQRAINFILSPVLGKHSLAYLDDVVIYSSTFSDHITHLSETLSLLSNAGFKLNCEKCVLAKTDFKFLGFRIDAEGIHPDPDKCRAINDMPTPRTAREVRRFLGAIGFFRRHIKNFSSISSPLTDLTKKSAKFRWTPEHQYIKVSPHVSPCTSYT